MAFALTRGQRDQQQVRAVAQRVQKRICALQADSDQTLRHKADDVRDACCGLATLTEDRLSDIVALSCEAVQRCLGLRLHDVQIFAGWHLATGRIVEMQTGEGKTLASVPAVVAHAMRGLGVHVATPNHYLANRDCGQLTPVFGLLGLTTGLLPASFGEEHNRQAYRADITYGTGYDFGFDFLRDQLAQRQREKDGWGASLLADLCTDSPQERLQRGHAFSLVDEADHVLLDDATSPLVLSGGRAQLAVDRDAVLLARKMAKELRSPEHFVIGGGKVVRLTTEGKGIINGPNVNLPVELLQRCWSDYVTQALIAEHCLRRHVHYVVINQMLQLVESGTGRIFADRSWRSGLHQAVEAKEGLPISAEKLVLAQVTRQRYYRLYATLAGMTGTANGCEVEFRQIYRASVQRVPLRIPSRRVVWPMRCFAAQSHKWNAIALSVEQTHNTGRPVLVGTQSIEQSELVAELLRTRRLPCVVLNGQQDLEESEVVARAGQQGAITVATNLAGRGTDIRLPADVEAAGGLHVIVSEPHESHRVDRQLVGRCARQGDRGSAQAFVSADDELIRTFAPWLTRALQRMSAPHGELSIDLAPRVRNLQRLAERMRFSARAALMRKDQGEEMLLKK